MPVQEASFEIGIIILVIIGLSALRELTDGSLITFLFIVIVLVISIALSFH